MLLSIKIIFGTLCGENQTHIFCSVTFLRKWCHSRDNVRKILQNRISHRWQYGAWALHAG